MCITFFKIQNSLPPLFLVMGRSQGPEHEPGGRECCVPFRDHVQSATTKLVALGLSNPSVSVPRNYNCIIDNQRNCRIGRGPLFIVSLRMINHEKCVENCPYSGYQLLMSMDTRKILCPMRTMMSGSWTVDLRN